MTNLFAVCAIVIAFLCGMQVQARQSERRLIELARQFAEREAAGRIGLGIDGGTERDPRPKESQE